MAGFIFDPKLLNIGTVWRAPSHFFHSRSCWVLGITELCFPGGSSLHGLRNPSLPPPGRMAPESKMSRHFRKVSEEAGNSALWITCAQRTLLGDERGEAIWVSSIYWVILKSLDIELQTHTTLGPYYFERNTVCPSRLKEISCEDRKTHRSFFNRECKFVCVCAHTHWTLIISLF